MISERSVKVTDRAIPGHWEGDLILCLEGSAIGTLMERTTRFQDAAAPAPNAGTRLDRFREERARLVCTRAKAVRDEIATGLDVCFRDPHSAWQRGANENTEGSLRRYFPKGTDLSAHALDALEAVAPAFGTRQRRSLGWNRPAEAFDEPLQSVQMAVATTG